MSRFLDAARRAEAHRLALPRDWGSAGSERASRPFQVLTVANDKGGVGKTTVAANLAVYFRALREDLPVLILSLDDQPMIDRMFGLGAPQGCETVTMALRSGSLASAIRLGQYGVHYVPSGSDISEFKRAVSDSFHLATVLNRTNWHGLIIIDTKSDFEILTRNAIIASDLTVIPVADQASLIQAKKIFDLLSGANRPRQCAQILLSLVDLRIRYRKGESRDILTLLVSEIRRQGYPLFESFLSRCPEVEMLQTNPDQRTPTILTGACDSPVHRQMHHLAGDMMKTLDQLAARR
jgi:cellulose biosynthesis protein BcsQ